ncbi:dienelactone hydrolase family protein [Candidatus Dependentiae bacterium]|nr:dienelactone hydrolase family protein [Candidatus Dependentiae bacterium]
MYKETLLELIGPFPTKVDLNPKVIESTDCVSYIREKVEYTTEANDQVRAYILIPKNLKGPAPAIYCHHQHAGNFRLGKSEMVGLAGDPDQSLAAELAERGYITFASDAVGFEERNWSEDKSGRAEYFEFATRLVNGNSLLAKNLHDISVGLNYLESRPEVDASRIGFIGHSYGGRMAIWFPVFDKRIKASVSNCGCVNYKDSLSKNVGIQLSFCIPTIMKYGDTEDVVKMVAPIPLYISATEDDKWSKGAQQLYDYAKPAFFSSELKLKVWPGKHIFTKEMREEAYSFLDKYLR